ncbi:MAG: P-type conjugative transfer protein TrbJ [Desulfarculales bacterium]|jgi:P-type conjugative transfer protein TrbJ|nr:P-type conjugative transfer protein TrbJ [Desulfarculales bacterium]
MRKSLSVFLLCLSLGYSNNALAWTVYCTNCSNQFTQALERATSVEELQVIYDDYAQSIQQTEHQLQILLTEINQYNNMLQNTMKLPAKLLNSITGDFGRLFQLTLRIEVQADELTALGDIFEGIYMNDDFLQGIAGAGRADREPANASYRQQREKWEQEVKRAEKSLFTLSGQQLNDLINDGAAFEEHMRELLTTPSGQMQALEAANELAAININESRQLRTLLTASVQASSVSAMKNEKHEEIQARQWQNATDAGKLRGVSGKNAQTDPF